MTQTTQSQPAFESDARHAEKEQLFAALYTELHRLAHRELYRNGRQGSINTTALLHEAYLSLSNRDDLSFSSREKFLAYVARAMRGIVIDAARRRRTVKHGVDCKIARVDVCGLADRSVNEQELFRIDEAMEELAQIDPCLAELVELRYFCGLTLAEIGALQGLTERSIQRKWEKVRLLLFDLITHRQSPG